MVRRLKSLQKRTMYDGARNLMFAWTLLCAIGVSVGLIKVQDLLAMTVVQRSVVEVITVSFWMTVWAYPVAGLGIIAFVTKPRVPVVRAVAIAS
jgi:hypothetical protein